MSINIGPPAVEELRPRITVVGVGGAGGNAIANMIRAGIEGVDFVVANTDAQALNNSVAEHHALQVEVRAVHRTASDLVEPVGSNGAGAHIFKICFYFHRFTPLASSRRHPLLHGNFVVARAAAQIPGQPVAHF